jgi:hypothetical protein
MTPFQKKLGFTLNLKGNAKTCIPTSTLNEATCPDACPFKASGCYAKAGPISWHWQKMSKTIPGATYELGRNIHKVLTLKMFLDAVKKLRGLWRLNQAGDLPHVRQAIHLPTLKSLINAAKNSKGFTYTHHLVTGKTATAKHNRAAIRHANKSGFTINLSANSLDHADKLARLNIGPVAVVVNSAVTANITTPQGRKIVICPATIRDDSTCATCGLCQRLRDFIIGFPAHGVAKKKMDDLVFA